MNRAAILMKQSADWVRWIRHFGDFITIPIAILIFAGLGGLAQLYLVAAALAGWTLVEYLMHRFAFHRLPVIRLLHQRHHDYPSDPDSERSSLSTPLVVAPFGLLVIGSAGLEKGSSIFAGLLSGYLMFIAIHYAVHRWPIAPSSWLYRVKLRHLIHHRYEGCNFGVTTDFWDIVFRTKYTTHAKGNFHTPDRREKRRASSAGSTTAGPNARLPADEERAASHLAIS